QLLEHISEYDDNLMEKYLEEKEITELEIISAIRTGVIKHQFIPVLCGSSLRNKGVQLLLDAINDYLPSPLDVPPAVGTEVDSEKEILVHADPSNPFSALAFKVQIDKYVGKLIYIRVYSGSIKRGDSIVNQSTGKKERVSRVLQVHSNKKKDIFDLEAGDIAAIVGPKNIKTGDTLTTGELNLLLAPITFPDSVISIAIEPKTKADKDNLDISLKKLEEEDPTFRVSQHKDTGQTLISGMGDLHLEIIIDRLKREFNVHANVGTPQVAYRESIINKVITNGEFIREMNGKGHYAIVKLKLSPLELDELKPGEKNRFINSIDPEVIPKEFWKAIQSSSLNACLDGPLMSNPIERVRIELIGGEFNEVDSNETAFSIASSIAVNNGLRKAKAVIMEPIMLVSIISPEDFVGEIIGDINAKRGRIEHIRNVNQKQEITAHIPMSELFGYSTRLRSISQGRADYTTEYLKHEKTPANIQEKILKKVRGF
ncbi:MAG: elongation factor G, partial [Candidatus Cloacimonadota bacterium]